MASVLAVRAVGTEAASNANLIVVLALLVAFPIGGVIAERLATERPVRHALAAAGLAWLVIGATVVSRGFTLARLVTLVLLVQVTVGLALLAAWVSHRKRSLQARRS